MASRIHRDLASAVARRRRGTSVATGSRLSRLVVLVACSTSLMGCVLRDFDYPEPVNVPPAVLGTVESPLDTVIQVDIAGPVGGDAGVSSDIPFVATVRDPNIDEPLVGLVFVDRDEDGSPDLPDISILPEQDDDPWDRRVTFSISRATFDARCHTVELHVSHGFVNFNNPQPATEGDLGVGVWWVAAYEEPSEPVDMKGCPFVTR